MAETYEQYEKNKGVLGPEGYRPLEDRMNTALDQTELLNAVRERVQAFVNAYEQEAVPEMEYVRRSREEGLTLRAQMVEADVQRIERIRPPGTTEEYTLLLDDLKILLDQFPQRS